MLQISSNPHSQSSLSAWLSALQLSRSKAWARKLCSKHKWATEGEITAPNVIESSQGASDSSAQPTNIGKGATKRVGCCLLEQYSCSVSVHSVNKGLYTRGIVQGGTDTKSAWTEDMCMTPASGQDQTRLKPTETALLPGLAWKLLSFNYSLSVSPIENFLVVLLQISMSHKWQVPNVISQST